MKKLIVTISVCVLYSCNCSSIYAQCNSWTQKTDFGGTARASAVGFSIGTKGYIGTGTEIAFDRKDFWEYDAGTDTWTQKADFGGVATGGAVGFSIGTKGYIGTGWASGKQFWEYDPSGNTWTQKTDLAGLGRARAVGFSIGNKGYIGLGISGSNFLKDLWEYDPSGDTWTQKTDFGDTARTEAVGFSIGSKGYIGTGRYYDGVNSFVFNDFWEYDATSNTWTQKADFGGTAREYAVGFSIGNKGYIGTGDDGTYKKDLWEYDPSGDTWTQKTDFGGTARASAVGFSIGNKGYIGTGSSFGPDEKDLWEYDPDYDPDLTANAGIAISTVCTVNGISIGGSPTAFGGVSPYAYSWTPSAGLDDATLANPTSTISDTTTYTVTVTDFNGCMASAIIVVSVYTDSQAICMVTVDSTSTRNIVVWEKNTFPASTDSFRIYRDIIGTYTHVGSVAYGSLSEFIDITNGINPNITSYRYSISTIDSCGNESILSDFHETIHLTTNSNFPTDVNLIWDAYEGFSFNYYRILRDANNTGNWVAIDSVSNTNFTYTDLSPPTDSTGYLVEVIPPSVCVSTKAKNWNSSKSNTSSVNQVSIAETSFDGYSFVIFPNPASEKVTYSIRLKGKQDVEIRLLNILGEEVYNEQVPMKNDLNEKSIDVSNLSPGVYNLQVITADGRVSKKVVIER